MITSTNLLVRKKKVMNLKSSLIFNENVHFWISTNNVFRIAERWAILNDIHIRRADFVAKPNFYFIRIGGQYYIKPNIRLAGGYSHLWLTPGGNWNNYQNENADLLALNQQ